MSHERPQIDHPFTGDEYAEAAVDRVMLATLSSGAQWSDLPPELAAKIIADGEDFVDRTRPANSADRRPTPWWRQPFAAWGTALASVIFAVVVVTAQPGRAELAAERIDAALARQAGTLELSWSGMGDPQFAAAAGYVRWNDARQQGVMRLRGLPANADNQQYQLWIVDPERDSNPVDGGVFDIVQGDNLILIDAKLEVRRPKAFALTLEQPGGVVVSDGPLLVIASG